MLKEQAVLIFQMGLLGESLLLVCKEPNNIGAKRLCLEWFQTIHSVLSKNVKWSKPSFCSDSDLPFSHCFLVNPFMI